MKYLKYAHENNMSFNELAETTVKEAMKMMKNKMGQFESDMSDTYNIFNELETILYKVGDAPTQPTEDELMNMLIGEYHAQKLSENVHLEDLKAK